MEASSPLAAMHPAIFIGYPRCSKDLMAMAPPRPFGPNDFNFKDLSMRMAMKKSQPDCFNIKPVQGSSPTTDLVADLSQNFTIDQSPVVPTPRRALFSNNVFAAGASMTTPPVPSSSPGIQDVDMDISPLPHKPLRYSIALQSPTSDITPNEAICMPSPPCSGQRPDSVSSHVQPERRKTAPLRPSLVKAKTLSSSLIEQQRPSLPPFRFGNYQDTKPATASSLSLEQIFEESSPLREASSPITAFQAARSRPLLDSTNIRNGSPLSVHMRKASNQTHSIRPRKQFRRAQSMYQTADDVMKQDTLPPVPAMATEVDCAQKLRLPTVALDQANDLPRINKETMIEVLDGKYDGCYARRVIIDCRFEYEYEGGHIKGAQNYNDKETLAAQLFEVEPSLQSINPTKPSLIIFHCEYSAHRAPLMAKFIRNKDRSVNAERYPALTYPEMYILDGGYSSFFKEYRARCFPQNYVEMDAKEHAAACERGMGKVKHAQRSKLLRAQTFAFGQHSPQHDSSPTAMGRCRTGQDVRMRMDMDVDMTLSYTPAKPDVRRPVSRLQSFPLS
ncbi:hypothetical protein DV736_g2656, partial [Chaetothyriales sp. CBS 134916]